MGMQVDEARRHDQTAGIDDIIGVARRDLADLGNATVLDADVATKPRQPASIDDHAAADHAIVTRHSFPPVLPEACGWPVGLSTRLGRAAELSCAWLYG